MTGCGKGLFWGKKLLVAAALLAGMIGMPGPARAESPEAQPPPDPAALLAEQNAALSRDLRRIHRELAALRADMSRPGLQEVFAGIGYIMGLFGAAAFAASRRRDKRPPGSADNDPNAPDRGQGRT